MRIGIKNVSIICFSILLLIFIISCKSEPVQTQKDSEKPAQTEPVKTPDVKNAQTTKEMPKEMPVVKVPGFYSAAEAYFSPDGKSLIFNAKLTKEDEGFDTFTVNLDGSNRKLINGKGDDA